MADSSSTSNFANSVLNPQVTDQVTTTNATVLGEAPAMAMGSLYQTIGNSVAMAAANAVYAQQQANVTYQTASTIAVAHLVGNS
ncbi:MAG: RebB family R body protein [Nannocystaceae bacterium]